MNAASVCCIQASCRPCRVDTLLNGRHDTWIQHWRVTRQSCIHATRRPMGIIYILKHYAAIKGLKHVEHHAVLAARHVPRTANSHMDQPPSKLLSERAKTYRQAKCQQPNYKHIWGFKENFFSFFQWSVAAMRSGWHDTKYKKEGGGGDQTEKIILQIFFFLFEHPIYFLSCQYENRTRQIIVPLRFYLQTHQHVCLHSSHHFLKCNSIWCRCEFWHLRVKYTRKCKTCQSHCSTSPSSTPHLPCRQVSIICILNT